MDGPTQAERLEQQLRAFEKLHTQELQAFEARLAAYMRLHADEVRQLRDQLAELRQSLSAGAPTARTAAEPDEAPPPRAGRPLPQEVPP